MRILRPEKELEVTPGPKAVEDLLELDSPANQGYETLRYVTANYGNRRRILESMSSLDVAHQYLGANTSTSWHSWDNAVQGCQDLGGFLPSAPLLLAVMKTLYLRQKVPQYNSLLQNLREEAKRGLWTSTEVDWQRKNVWHYRNQFAPPSTKPPNPLGLSSKPDKTPTSLERVYSDLSAPELKEMAIGRWDVNVLAKAFGADRITISYQRPKEAGISGVIIQKIREDIVDIHLDTPKEEFYLAHPVKPS